MAKVLIVGQGELGWRTLQILSQSEAVSSLVAVDASADRVGRTLMVDHASTLFRPSLTVEFRQIDVLDEERTTELIAAVQPDVIINTASLQSWWVITLLPERMWRRLHQTGFGVWLPAHLAPIHSLMRAVKGSGSNVPVVNMAFPDATNVILDRIGLSPTLGAGNVEELSLPLRAEVAKQRDVQRSRVNVRMVAHHSVNSAILEERRSTDLPLLCRVLVDDEDITDSLDIADLLLTATLEFPPGAEDTWLIAASAGHKALALLNEEAVPTHATGVGGLQGGYPVLVGGGGVALDLPAGIDEKEAAEVNERGARLDGIAEIRDDGEVILVESSVALMRDLLGWELRSFIPADAAQLGKELTARYSEFAKGHLGRA